MAAADALPVPSVDAGGWGETSDPREAYVRDLLNARWKWFSEHASGQRAFYLSVKVIQIVLAAAVPVAASVHAPVAVTGGLGALIVVLEGVQQLFQWHDCWIRYRTAETALRRERFLYQARAGGYGSAADPVGLLAERIDQITSSESAGWAKTFGSSSATDSKADQPAAK
jgi:Protein of unknown function (DUF4231)